MKYLVVLFVLLTACRNSVKKEVNFQSQTIHTSEIVGSWSLIGSTSGWGHVDSSNMIEKLVILDDLSYKKFSDTSLVNSGLLRLFNDTLFNGSIISKIKFDNSDTNYDANIYNHNQELRLQLSKPCDDCGSIIYRKE